MTDINELVQRIKAAAVRAKAAAENYSAGKLSLVDCINECAEFNALTDGPEQILSLVEALEKAQQRVSERESRTVTVKLPEPCVGVVQGGHAVMVPYAAGHWFNKTAILEMLTAAGIKWEAE